MLHCNTIFHFMIYKWNSRGICFSYSSFFSRLYISLYLYQDKKKGRKLFQRKHTEKENWYTMLGKFLLLFLLQLSKIVLGFFLVFILRYNLLPRNFLFLLLKTRSVKNFHSSSFSFNALIHFLCVCFFLFKF